MHPTIGLMLGDRHGIGAELMAKLLGDRALTRVSRLVVVGDPAVFEFGRRSAKEDVPFIPIDDLASAPAHPEAPLFLARRPAVRQEIGLGRARAEAGAEMLDNLAYLLSLAERKLIDGIVFAPLNKQAMRLGGLREGDELDFITEKLGFTGNAGELNVLGSLWTSRVTSHVPLRQVAELITEKSVLAAIRLIEDTLRASGRANPKIAVAGLNPHAGDGGAFGNEEQLHIAPAIAKARAAGIRAEGPFPADTVFVSAQKGSYDAVVSMYHDQGQIAMKLMNFGSGVTVLAGIPVPVTTVGHGTAYDIVGKGIAKPDGLRHALEICRSMALSKLSASAA